MSFPIVTWRRVSWLEPGRSAWVCGTWNYTAQKHQTKASVGKGTCSQLLPLGVSNYADSTPVPKYFHIPAADRNQQRHCHEDERETLGSKKVARDKQGNSCCCPGLLVYEMLLVQPSHCSLQSTSKPRQSGSSRGGHERHGHSLRCANLCYNCPRYDAFRVCAYTFMHCVIFSNAFSLKHTSQFHTLEVVAMAGNVGNLYMKRLF